MLSSEKSCQESIGPGSGLTCCLIIVCSCAPGLFTWGSGSEASWAKEGAVQLKVQTRNTANTTYAGERVPSFGMTGFIELTVSSFLLCHRHRVESEASG